MVLNFFLFLYFCLQMNNDFKKNTLAHIVLEITQWVEIANAAYLHPPKVHCLIRTLNRGTREQSQKIYGSLDKKQSQVKKIRHQ